MKKLIFKYYKTFILFLILFLFVVISSIIKVPYDIVSPAGINEIDKVIEIDTSYEEKGSFNTVSVFANEKISLLTYLFALCDRSTQITKTYQNYNLSNAESYRSGTIQKQVSINNAIIAGYNSAKYFGYDVDINYHYEGYIIDTYYSYMTKNTLKIGDIITHVGTIKLDCQNSFSYYFNQAIENDQIKLTVKRNGDILNFTLTKNDYINYYGEKSSGFGFYGYDYYIIDNAYPAYQVNKSTTIGPSGGLLQTLAVFNALTFDYDYTNGLKIVGTGTITTDGVVGEIGGMYQKIITSDIMDADVFFVPVYRYQGITESDITISNDGYWQIAKYKTKILANTSNIPYINKEGYWQIEDKVIIKAIGDIYPYLNENNLDEESNFLEAYRAYFNLKKPKMDLIFASTIDDALRYLVGNINPEALKIYNNAYYLTIRNQKMTVDEWFNSIKEV